MILKIVFVVPSFAGGGAERVMIALANRCDRELFSPSILALDETGPLRKEVSNDVQVISLGKRSLRSALIALGLSLRRQAPDIVVSTIGHLNLGVLMLRPFLPRGTRILVREANDPMVTVSAIGLMGAGKYLYQLLYPRATRVIVPSKLISEVLTLDFGLDEKLIFRLSNPVDVEAIRAAAVEPFREPGDGLRFVAAGRLTPQKGFDRLLQGLSDFPLDFHLTILGEGEDYETLLNARDRLGLSERVSFVGFVANPWRYFAGADAFLLPSRWEGMPNAALEALTCGTPVVATPEAGGIMEIAAAATARAVTIAPDGEMFCRVLGSVLKGEEIRLRKSLLPDQFSIEVVVGSFERILLGDV